MINKLCYFLFQGINGFEVQKQNCGWLLVTHKPCEKDDVVSFGNKLLNSGTLNTYDKNRKFKVIYMQNYNG